MARTPKLRILSLVDIDVWPEGFNSWQCDSSDHQTHDLRTREYTLVTCKMSQKDGRLETNLCVSDSPLDYSETQA